MPTRKRKRDYISANPIPQTSALLLLPLEIREMIWPMLYYPVDALQLPKQATVHHEQKPIRVVSSKKREREFFEHSKCSSPLSHQALLLTCRQTYKECWQYYVLGHSLSFSRPVTFANNFLSFQPLENLSMIRNLSFRVDDGSSLYNPASRSAMRGMVSDLSKLFQHYPDVFRNLLSFTWELCDRRVYAPERVENEAAMFSLVHDLLVDQLTEHQAQHSTPLGSESMGSPSVKSDVSSPRWQVGIASRARMMLVGAKMKKSQEQSSLVFFERMPPDHQFVDPHKVSLRMIKLDEWFTELLPTPASYGGVSIKSITEPREVCRPVRQSPYTRTVFSPEMRFFDTRLEFNWLRGLALFSIRA